MLVEEENAVTSYLVNGNGTFVDNDVRDIYWGHTVPYTEALWVSSLKDLMFFDDELPNLVDLMEDYETNLHLSMHDARDKLLQAWEDSYG